MNVVKVANEDLSLCMTLCTPEKLIKSKIFLQKYLAVNRFDRHKIVNRHYWDALIK